MGRTLGFMESVNLAIVSGLAVDYTLHIAHLYQHSEKSTRFERVQVRCCARLPCWRALRPALRLARLCGRAAPAHACSIRPADLPCLLVHQEAMSKVGISIFSGATTTLLASSMLFCAYIKMR